MFSGQDLVDFAKRAKKNGVKYLYGGNFEILTPERLDALRAQSPSHISDNRYNYALNNYIGKTVTDCSGLIYGYTRDGSRRTSQMLYNKAGSALDIPADLSEIPVGAVLWKPGHVGIYQGDGKTIEALGFDYGIVERDVTNTDFQKYLLFNDFVYNMITNNNIIWLVAVGGVVGLILTKIIIK